MFDIQSMLHYGSPWWVTTDAAGVLMTVENATQMMGSTAQGSKLNSNRLIITGIQWNNGTDTATLNYITDDGGGITEAIMELTGVGSFSPCWIPLPSGVYTPLEDPARLTVTGTISRLVVCGILTDADFKSAITYTGSPIGSPYWVDP